MKNKSGLVYLIFFLCIIIISCKKEFNPDEYQRKRENSADSIVSIADGKFRGKDFEEVDRLCYEAINVNPGHARAVMLMGLVRYEKGNYSKAIELFTIVIDKPKNSLSFGLEGVYEKRALSKEALNDFKGAIEDYNIMIESFNSGFAYYQRGVLKHDFFDDLNGACLDWSKAGEKGIERAYDLIDRYCNN